MKILYAGHSHMNTLARAATARVAAGDDAEAVVLQLRAPEFRLQQAQASEQDRSRTGPKRVAGVNQGAIREFLRARGPFDAAVLCFNGNEHNLLGLFRQGVRPERRRDEQLIRSVTATLGAWLEFFLPLLDVPLLLVPPPPPIAAEEKLREFSSRLVGEVHIERAPVRLALWQRQREAIAEECAAHGVELLELPETVFDAQGFLSTDCIGNATHGNDRYGALVVSAVMERLVTMRPGPAPSCRKEPPGSPVDHPYRNRPDRCYWRQAVEQPAADAIDPAPLAKFHLSREDRVATAGSCFAQHISRHLQARGFNYLVTERAGADSADDPEYAFSALYGNIYTSRQLLQLLQRAFGFFTPLERAWLRPDGRYCDAFRPRLHREGYASVEAVAEAERTHLEQVCRMFTELDVLVFTLGLTECWASRLDGAVYPLAPGVAGGVFDPARHVFLNLSVAEVTQDLLAFLRGLHQVNPRARVVLTVSPVPLVATATPEHVLVANTRSKAVLRTAADEIAAGHDNVVYFPSYEIIAGVPGKLAYFAADCRSVTAAGVAHVMGVFMRSMVMPGESATPAGALDEATIEELLDAECDEELLGRPA